MASLQTQIFEHLRDDDGTQKYAEDPDWVGPVTPLVGTRDAVTDPANPIWSGILQGGLYDRPIRRETQAATPDAFYQTERGQNIRASGWVRAPSRSKHAFGFGAYEGICRVYLFSTRSRDGRDRIEQGSIRIRELIEGWSFVSAEGRKVSTEYDDFVEPYDSEEFFASVATYCRIRIRGSYGNEI